GNPLAARAEKDENAAAAWAESQDIWGSKELAAMWIELGKRNDPDEPDEAAVALRMFDRATAIDPANGEAAACAARVLAGQGRIDEAITRAQKSGSARLRVQTLDFVGDHAGAQLAKAAVLVDREALDEMNSEGLGGLVATFGEHAPNELETLLGALPA